MPDRVFKTLVKTDGNRRVQILQRADGLFSFVEQRLSRPEIGEPCWVPASHALPICETADMAEREAATRVEWLGRETAG